MIAEDLATVTDTIPVLPRPEIEHELIHADGVYFGLPDDEYHAALALSASGIKSLRISTLDWWARSPLNPDQEDVDTEAKTIGRAYHKRILEGREAFLSCYAARIEPEDHPDAWRTVDDLKLRCADLGLKVSGKKQELIDRLCERDPEHRGFIWDCLVEDHARKNAGREFLPRKLMHRIEISAAMIEKHPQLGKAFSGGYPEVSVFWRDRDSGVPCKVRLDYWKRAAIVDLKTFENQMGAPVDKAIARAVAAQKYHIQAAFYLEGRRAALRLIDERKVFGDVDPAFIASVRAALEAKFLFVFQQKGVAPLARGKILPEGLTLDLGRYEIDQAKAAFANCWATFGTGPWLDVSDIAEFDSTDFPAFISD